MDAHERFVEKASEFARRVLQALESRDERLTVRGQGVVRVRCVLHDGEKRDSLAIFPSGNGHCHSRCGSLSRQQIADALGIEYRSEPLSVTGLAQALALEEEFLRDAAGLSDKRGGGIWIPVLDENGTQLYRRERVSIDGSFKFKQPDGVSAEPYGLWKLDNIPAGADVFVVEGESDVWSLWYGGAPAVGISGATQKKAILKLAAILAERDLKPIICREPGSAGGLFALAWADAFPEARLVSIPPEAEDWSSIWRSSNDRDDFREKIERLRQTAQPVRIVVDRELKEQIDASWESAEGLLIDPDLWSKVRQSLSERYVGETAPAELAFLAGVSALLPSRESDPTTLPLRIGHEGPAAAGKTAAVDAGMALLPPEAKAEFKATSEKAFIHSPREFANRVFVMMEADSLPEDGAGASAFRSMCDGTGADYEVVVTDPSTGELTTRRILKEGPTAIVITSTKEHLAQMASRLMPVHCDSSPGQTERVLRHQARLSTGIAVPTGVQDFHDLYTWLRLSGAKDVIVPFAEQILDALPKPAFSEERIRRDFPQFIATIRTLAFMHQRQRSKDEAGRILAARDDYKIALGLLSETFGVTASGGVTESTRAVIYAVSELAPQHAGGVPTREVVAQLQGTLGKSQVNSHLKRAQRKGYLDNKTPGRGRAGHWVPDASLPEKTLLPSVESVFDGGVTGIRPEGRKVMAVQGESELPSDLPADFLERSNTSTSQGKEDVFRP